MDTHQSHSSSEKAVILVIEDEEMVREVALAMIERMGHEVLPSETGYQAIEIAGNHPGTIHLAFMDLGLPDMTCEELYRALKNARPRMKFIVCSGAGADAVPLWMSRDGTRFLEKPYSYDELMQLIDTLLKQI